MVAAGKENQYIDKSRHEGRVEPAIEAAEESRQINPEVRMYLADLEGNHFTLPTSKFPGRQTEAQIK